MGKANVSGTPSKTLGAIVIRRLLMEPGTWSAARLATELGEAGPRRVQRIVQELEQSGWTVIRDDPGQRLTIQI